MTPQELHERNTALARRHQELCRAHSHMAAANHGMLPVDLMLGWDSVALVDDDVVLEGVVGPAALSALAGVVEGREERGPVGKSKQAAGGVGKEETKKGSEDGDGNGSGTGKSEGSGGGDKAEGAGGNAVTSTDGENQKKVDAEGEAHSKPAEIKVVFGK